jgi:hypothetical protein
VLKATPTRHTPSPLLGRWELGVSCTRNQPLKLPTSMCWEVLGLWVKLPTPPNKVPTRFVGSSYC